MSNLPKTKVGWKARLTLRLFTPVQVGRSPLTQRVVMAPLTRSRSEQPGDIPGDLMLEHYTLRASEGGLIISEGTSISIAGRGWSSVWGGNRVAVANWTWWNMEPHVGQQPGRSVRLCCPAIKPVRTRVSPHHRTTRQGQRAHRRRSKRRSNGERHYVRKDGR